MSTKTNYFSSRLEEFLFVDQDEEDEEVLMQIAISESEHESLGNVNIEGTVKCLRLSSYSFFSNRWCYDLEPSAFNLEAALDQVLECENNLEAIALHTTSTAEDDEIGSEVDGSETVNNLYLSDDSDGHCGLPKDSQYRYLRTGDRGSYESNHNRNDRVRQNQSISRGRRCSGRGREQRIKDAVEEVLPKLRWYQIKSEQEIAEASHNSEKDDLLLLFKTHLASVVGKAEMLLAGEVSTKGSPKEDLGSSPAPDLKKCRHLITGCIVAIRRGGDKISILSEINKLIDLCFSKNGICLAVVKQMLAEGVLESLLSPNLLHANDWLEVEIQIAKIISVLVTYEDDWALLQRNALAIVSFLYSLQVKTAEKNKLQSRAQSSLSDQAVTTGATEASIFYLKAAKDVCTLIAAAVAKLALVLSSKWGAEGTQAASQSTLMTSYSSTSGNSNRPRSLSNTSSLNNDMNRLLDFLYYLIRTVCENAANLTSSDEAILISPSDSASNLSTVFGQSTTLSEVESPGGGAKSPGCSFPSEKFEMEADVSSVPLPDICNARVLCSAALSTLTEVPHCRHLLVKCGCLQLIKNWLDSALLLLSKARDICFGEGSDPQQVSNESFVLNFTKQFGTVYELLSNAMAALMYLSGGSDDRFQSASQPNTTRRRSESKTSYEYEEGWIDAQMLAEGIPDLIVSLVFTSTEFVLDFPKEKDDLTRSVLPGSVAMHLAKVLFQLCSRVQNRQKLVAARAPIALAMLFESICSRINQYDIKHPSIQSDSIFSHIFAFTGVFYNQVHSLGKETSQKSSAIQQWESAADLAGIYSNGIDEENKQRLSLTNPQAAEKEDNRFAKISQREWSGTDDGYQDTSSKKISLRHLDPNTELIMTSVTLSCLQSLSSFLSDEMKEFAELELTSGLSVQSSLSSPPQSARSSLRLPSDFTLPSTTTIQSLIPTVSVIRLMSYPQFIRSVKRSASFFNRGMELISVLRLIGMLSESNESLTALVDENVTDVLMMISTETEDRRHLKLSSSGHSQGHLNETNSSSPSLTIIQAAKTTVGIPSRPGPIERSVSASSNVSSKSDKSFYSNGGRRSHRRSSTPIIHLASNGSNDEGDFLIEDGLRDSKALANSEMISEVTMLVCFSLANIITFERAASTRYFNNGLFTIMKELLQGTRDAGICIQSILCIKAMCNGVFMAMAENPSLIQSLMKSKYLLEALDSLSIALRSTHTEIQQHAISAITCIAPLHESLRDHIVEHQLKSVLSLSMDPQKKRKLSTDVEKLLISIGFAGGEKDFECCGFDCDLLRVWYKFERSLKPQGVARAVLADWLENIFPLNVSVSSSSSKLEKELNPRGLANETVEILRSSSLGKLYSSKKSLLGHQSLSSSKASSPDVSIPCIPHHINHSNHSSHHRGEREPLPIPIFQRSITDSFLKYLPFCTVKPDPPSKVEHHFESFLTSPVLRGTFYGAQPDSDTPDDPHKPPKAVTNLFDLFYSSKLHQLMLTDLLSLGLSEYICPPSIEASSETGIAISSSEDCLTATSSASLLNADSFGLDDDYSNGQDDMRTLLPVPYEVNAIRLPSRTYETFARMGRMIQRMIDSGERKLWSLTFSDSHFENDFHSKLSDFLNKCPQIFSLCFDSTTVVEDKYDQRLGYCIGHIPANIKFVSIKRTLSRESIQNLCVSLRTQNAAFKSAAPNYDSSVHSSKKQNRPGDNSSGKNISIRTSDAPLGKLPRARFAKGLLGLALTHCSLEMEEIKHIVELLDVSLSFNRKVATPSANSSSRKSAISIVTPHTSQQSLKGLLSPSTPISTPRNFDPNAFLRGLRYLDLSHNSLSDSICAKILTAALNGPLEALELGGNYIYKGAEFSEAMTGFDKLDRSNRWNVNPNLRYLGLSGNHLTSSAIASLFKSLSGQCSITYIDLSSNDIEDIKSVRSFLINNSTLRVMDLSHNKINDHCLSEMSTALLENKTLLLMPLEGNTSIERSKNLPILLSILKQHRIEYAKASTSDIQEPTNDAQTGEILRQSFEDKSTEGKFPPREISENKKGESFVATATTSPLIYSGSEKSMPVAKMVNDESDKVRPIASPHTKLEMVRPSSIRIKEPPPKLHVFFSSPLAYQDREHNYHMLELLDYNAERDMLIKVFKDVHRDVAVHFDFATTESLRNALSLGCRALHFSGHGLPGGLCFEDEKSGLQVLNVQKLSGLLSAGGIKLQFVFVSACYSKAIGEAFVKAGVPHVVCVKVESKIQDVAAISFTKAFYVAFLSGNSVLASFRIAKEALKNSPYVENNVLEGEKFILLPDSEDSTSTSSSSSASSPPTFSSEVVAGSRLHDEVLFNSRQVSDWPPSTTHCTIGRVPTDVATFLARNQLPKPPHEFEGREVSIHMLIRLLLDRRLVSLVGVDGIGKSSLAIAAVNYLADRELFRDSIVFFRAKGLDSYRTFLLGFQNALLNSIVGEEMKAKKNQAGLESSSNSNSNDLFPEEELIFSCLASRAMLIVIDHIDDLLSSYQTQDFKLFLSRLFEMCPHIKILVVSTDTLKMRNVNVSSMVEYSLTLGPLSLGSTLRLFARLTPSLLTAESKDQFIRRLLPKDKEHLTAEMNIDQHAADILSRLGNGHPSQVIYAASESTTESVNEMLNTLGQQLPQHNLQQQQQQQHHLQSAGGPVSSPVEGNYISER